MRSLVLGMSALLLIGCKPKTVTIQPTRAQKAVPTSDLARVGTIGDAPRDRIEVGLTADGRIVTISGEVDLDRLRAHLVTRTKDADRREPDGSSHRDVVLRVHPSLPFEVVFWTICACADPQVRAYRIHFAVRPEEGEEEGTMAVFLPKDRGLAAMPSLAGVPRTFRLRLLAHEMTVDSGTAYATYRAMFSADPDATAEVDVGPGVAAGHVIRTVDLLLRAGAKNMAFCASSLPLKPPSETTAGTGRTALQEYVASQPARVQGFKVRVANRDLLGGGPAQTPPPPMARVRGGVAGYAPEGDETGEEPPEPMFVEEEMPEEPVETEEDHIEVDTDAEFDDNALSDAPFSGPATNSAIGLGGGAGGGRRGRAGSRNLRAGGGSGLTENAVELGLKWLADHQDVDDDGKWDCDDFMKHDPPGDKCDGGGQALYDVGVTGLAVLAFLGAGFTDRGDVKENKYAKNVRQGLRYLMQCQADDGIFGTRATHSFMYNHAIATLAVSEAFWMTRNPRYKKAAQDGINFIAKARNPGGAWRYDPRGGENDTSVTAWCVMALKSGKYAGLEVAPDAFEGARVWINKMTDPDSGRVGYDHPGGLPARPEGKQDRFPPGKSQSMTGAGILCRIYLGEDPRSSEMIRKGADLCCGTLPTWNPDGGSIDMYYWYYATLALFQVGGVEWRKWNDAMKEAIVMHQHPKDAGARAGSWDPLCVWGEDGGRVYSTAMLVMCLEVYYRYDRVFGVK